MEPAEFLNDERAKRELIRTGNQPTAYRVVARCIYQLVKCEDVSGGVLITPIEEHGAEEKAGPS